MGENGGGSATIRWEINKEKKIVKNKREKVLKIVDDVAADMAQLERNNNKYYVSTFRYIDLYYSNINSSRWYSQHIDNVIFKDNLTFSIDCLFLTSYFCLWFFPPKLL